MTNPDKCPFCGQPLVDEAAIEHLHRSEERYRTKLGRDLKKELRAEVEAKLAAREQKLAREADLLEKEKDRVRTEFAARQKEMRAELEGEFKARQRKLQRAIDRLEKRNEKIRAEVESEFFGRQQKLQRLVDRLQEQREKLQREVEHLQAPELGKIDETWVFEHLVSAFGIEGDEIRHEGDLRRGGDIVHVVKYSDGERPRRAGLILYEIKNTGSWSKSYIDQIKADGLRRKTPYLLLVSRKLPRKEKGMCVEDGVVIADQAHALHLARVLRRMVIDTYCAERAGEDHALKTEQLYEYLNSDDFRGEIGAVVAAGRKLTEMLQTERRSHERTWTKREQAYAELERRSISLDQRIDGIIHSEPSKPNGTKATRPRSRRRRQRPAAAKH